jgi:hypothetical protein
MPRVGFEPTISAGERPQTYALDRAVTDTGLLFKYAKHKQENTTLHSNGFQNKLSRLSTAI